MPENVRVVVLRGAGDAFSAGIDTAMFTPGGRAGRGERGPARRRRSGGASSGASRPTRRASPRGASARPSSWPQVHGYAIGAGFQLALAADLRVAALDAWFAMRETSLGLVPDLGGTGPLVHLVGYARALEICATGRKVSAPEALTASGSSARSHPAADLEEATGSLVEALLAAPTPALRALKPLLRGAVDGDRDGQLAARARGPDRPAPGHARRLRRLMTAARRGGMHAPLGNRCHHLAVGSREDRRCGRGHAAVDGDAIDVA